MICWKISIFAQAYTSSEIYVCHFCRLWFAEKIVSLHKHIHLSKDAATWPLVVICWKISIFAQAYTSDNEETISSIQLWFAEKLVSLHKHIHPKETEQQTMEVVICWKISIFAQAYTSRISWWVLMWQLWFAEKLVSLHKHIHRWRNSPSSSRRCDLLKN